MLIQRYWRAAAAAFASLPMTVVQELRAMQGRLCPGRRDALARALQDTIRLRLVCGSLSRLTFGDYLVADSGVPAPDRTGRYSQDCRVPGRVGSFRSCA